ncbi:hypothetical protein [Sphingomonas sp.]|uniref:hypothetical protein n=1 Tax=Sphingomonas sp. TaxID=28214 RepID=UPI002ED894F8
MTLISSLLFLMAPAQGVVAAQQNVLPKAPNARLCRMPEGWDQVMAQDPRYIVFGELHGTEQGPEFIGNLACALAAKGQRILVAVEKSAADDRELQTAWRLPADQFAGALSHIGWLGRDDGVASEAMFAMLVRLHGLKESGLPIGVVAFNGVKDEDQAKRFADLPGQGPHEAAQAENIAQAARLANYDRTLVLVGNFHARKDSIEWRGVQFDPMAKRLARHGKTVTLNMLYAAGSNWSCVLKPGAKVEPNRPITADLLDCGNHLTKGSPDLGRAPFIELDPARSGSTGDYDGFFWVGPISGSAPFAPDR